MGHLGVTRSRELGLLAVGVVAGCAPAIFQATDGSLYQDEADPSAEAALASAERDLPCDRASIVVVGRKRFHTLGEQFRLVPSVLEGCGQRVTYLVVHAEESGDAAGRYVMFSRVPTAAATAPSR